MKHILLLILFVCAIFINNNSAQDLYAIDTIRTAYLNFYSPSWESTLDSFKINNLEDRVLASITIDGILYDSVGVRFKGNSSYNSFGQSNKKPFNIKIDYTINQDVYGYTTLKLNNMFKDPSCVREVLSYELLSNYMPVSKANYMNIYINGNLHGLYTSVESVNNDFLTKHFESDDNSFFKCDPNWGAPPPMGCPPGNSMPTLTFAGTDTACYKNSYEIKSDSSIAWVKLLDLIQLLDNTPNQVSQLLDVDRALWMLVYNNIFVNLDSYTGSGHNYYLYENDYNIFNTIIWDLNENYGCFSNAGGQPPSNLSLNDMQNFSPTWNDQNNQRPLIKKILANSDYKKRFFAHYRTIIDEFLITNAMKNRAVVLQNMIDPYVSSDPNLIYSYNDFQNGLNQSMGNMPGINALMDPRLIYLQGHSEIIKIAPSISNIQQLPLSPTYNDNVWINANISNSTQAKLHYKSALQAPFIETIMYDDGNNNDGGANDGVFGAMIPSFNPATRIYYYIYADNQNAGRFSPERAEYEFYSYLVQGEQISIGDIVINEFMASNSNTESDQNGEFDDWIELYNNTNNDISLNNMFLSDDLLEPYKWQFPDTIIAANDFLIVWADDDAQQGLHAEFKLSSSGETLIFSNSDSTLLDSITYPNQSTDITYGRYPNGTGSFQYLPSTFGTYNQTLSTYENTLDFLIFPNPAKDELYIRINNNLDNNNICIYNSLMQLIFETKWLSNNVHNIPLNTFSNGLYFIKIDNQINKFVVAR